MQTMPCIKRNLVKIRIRWRKAKRRISEMKHITLQGNGILNRAPHLAQWLWQVYYANIQLGSPFKEVIIRVSTITSKAFFRLLEFNCCKENILGSLFDPKKADPLAGSSWNRFRNLDLRGLTSRKCRRVSAMWVARIASARRFLCTSASPISIARLELRCTG